MDSQLNPVLVEVKLGEIPLKVLFGLYQDGTPAMEATGFDDGYDQPWATLTTNLTPYGGDGDLGPWEMWVKAHDENESLARAVLATGIFVDTGRSRQSGYSSFSIWQLQPDKLAEGVFDQCRGFVAGADTRRSTGLRQR